MFNTYCYVRERGAQSSTKTFLNVCRSFVSQVVFSFLFLFCVVFNVIICIVNLLLSRIGQVETSHLWIEKIFSSRVNFPPLFPPLFPREETKEGIRPVQSLRILSCLEQNRRCSKVVVSITPRFVQPNGDFPNGGRGTTKAFSSVCVCVYSRGGKG